MLLRLSNPGERGNGGGMAQDEKIQEKTFFSLNAEEVPKQLIPAAYFCTSHLKYKKKPESDHKCQEFEREL